MSSSSLRYDRGHYLGVGYFYGRALLILSSEPVKNGRKRRFVTQHLKDSALSTRILRKVSFLESINGTMPGCNVLRSPTGIRGLCGHVVKDLPIVV
jgi:hypothetical protein